MPAVPSRPRHPSAMLGALLAPGRTGYPTMGLPHGASSHKESSRICLSSSTPLPHSTPSLSITSDLGGGSDPRPRRPPGPEPTASQLHERQASVTRCRQQVAFAPGPMAPWDAHRGHPGLWANSPKATVHVPAMTVRTSAPRHRHQAECFVLPAPSSRPGPSPDGKMQTTASTGGQARRDAHKTTPSFLGKVKRSMFPCPVCQRSAAPSSWSTTAPQSRPVCQNPWRGARQLHHKYHPSGLQSGSAGAGASGSHLEWAMSSSQ